MYHLVLEMSENGESSQSFGLSLYPKPNKYLVHYRTWQGKEENLYNKKAVDLRLDLNK